MAMFSVAENRVGWDFGILHASIGRPLPSGLRIVQPDRDVGKTEGHWSLLEFISNRDEV